MWLFLRLFFINFILHLINSSIISWKVDDIKYSTLKSYSSNTTTLSVTILSNGPIYPYDFNGHFRYNLSIIDENGVSYSGLTQCIPITDSASQITTALTTTIFHSLAITTSKLQDFYNIITKKDYHNPNSTYSKTTFNVNLTPKKDAIKILSMQFAITKNKCAVARTIGSWDDNARWDLNTYPVDTDHVNIPQGAGVITLSDDVQINQINTYGGLIKNYNSACPEGWMIDPGDNGNLGSFDDAEFICNTVGFGSLDAHLVQIKDRNELETVKRICRVGGESPSGCWIGMKDKSGNGDFDWIEPQTVGHTDQSLAPIFMDWRRNEPNNHTVSEGIFTNGELCVELIPWLQDPLIVEQGSWNDLSCKLKKPFVCQLYAVTTRYTITINTIASLEGGGMEGGSMRINGTSDIQSFTVTRTGVMNITKSASNSIIRNLHLENGSSLYLEANVFFQSNGSSSISTIGENSHNSFNMMQPLILIHKNVTVTIGSNNGYSFGQETFVNAKLIVLGSIHVNSNVSVYIQ
eukprot:gene8814-11902_t